ncbi:MAG TPA: FMN-binding protein [Phycisphaerae bacterium]|nr:FMN-binding protein [Phycisphaerae bacterium]
MKKFIHESWLVLVLGIVFALLLAGTQTQLADQISQNQQKALNEAIAAVVPEIAAVVPEAAKARELTDAQGRPVVAGCRVFRCLNAAKQPVGWAVQASGTGFVDKIVLVFGLSDDGEKITGLKVIENVETPGLGNKIAEDKWAGQYKGLSAARKIVVQKGPAVSARNEIQAITGATWSSRYVTDIINQAAEKVRPKLNEHR